MMYGAQRGLAGPQKAMAVLLGINQNGQAITLSKQLREAGVSNGAPLAKHAKTGGRPLSFAQTFPTGTHAMWLYYWRGSVGINPMSDVKTIVVPPPQMVANMRVGNMDGFCVGQPWGARAICDKIGFTATTTQQIWPDHPEKVLGTTCAFIEQYQKPSMLPTRMLRSEEHTSELQSRENLVCRLLLEKKNTIPVRCARPMIPA